MLGKQSITEPYTQPFIAALTNTLSYSLRDLCSFNGSKKCLILKEVHGFYTVMSTSYLLFANISRCVDLSKDGFL